MNSVLLWRSMNSVLLWNNLNYTELSPAPLKSSFGSQTISSKESSWRKLVQPGSKCGVEGTMWFMFGFPLPFTGVQKLLVLFYLHKLLVLHSSFKTSPSATTKNLSFLQLKILVLSITSRNSSEEFSSKNISEKAIYWGSQAQELLQLWTWHGRR